MPTGRGGHGHASGVPAEGKVPEAEVVD
jgi:hypothetical protein